MDAAYFSHVPILSACMSLSSGPVLELGAGYGSTPMLHGLCAASNRPLTTLESNADWLDTFTQLRRDWHTIKSVPDFLDIPEYKQYWGLAFVDHGIALQRAVSITNLRHVPIIVVHDTCHPWLYDYEPLISSFQYRWNFKVNGPQTTVISDWINVRKLLARICL